MRWNVPPQKTAAFLVWGVTFLIQAPAVYYLAGLFSHSLIIENQQLKIEIAQTLGAQMDRALAANDDLTALMVLKSCRTLHPQILKAMIFNQQGTILLHTDPGKMRQHVRPPTGPRATGPEASVEQRHGKPLLRVLVPLPESAGYFQAVFDDSQKQQAWYFALIRIGLLSFITACLSALTAWWFLKRFDWMDPHQPSKKTLTHDPTQPLKFVLTTLSQATLVIDRNNQILAINPLALTRLQCPAEELEGIHILRATLPTVFIDFYQKAIKNPATPSETRLALKPGESPLPIRITCSPASSAWEYVVVNLG